MRLWNTLTNAVTGWVMIVRHQPGWRDHFRISVPGLVAALALFAFAAFLAVAFASMSIGMPNAAGVAAAMFVLALPVTSLVVTLIGTRMVLGSDQPLLDLLVPGVYLLTAFLLLEGFLAMLGGPIVMMSWVALAYLLYRLARITTDWAMATASAFAVLTVVLLVAMRMALYMLTSPPAPSV